MKLDGREQRVAVDTKFYKHLDHGYAATVHKAQGSTVDRTYVLATPHFDRHATYVALSGIGRRRISSMQPRILGTCRRKPASGRGFGSGSLNSYLRRGRKTLRTITSIARQR